MITSENIDQIMTSSIALKTSDIDENAGNDWPAPDCQNPSEFESSEAQAPVNRLQQAEQEENDTADDGGNTDVTLVPNPGTDERDRHDPSAYRVSRFDIGCKWASIFLHTFDIASDYFLMVQYLLDREWSNFAWTMGVVLISSVVNILISMRMYNRDFESDPNRPRGPKNKMANKLLWSKYYWPVVLVLQLPTLLRSWETLKYARESDSSRKKGDWSNQKKYYKKMLKEDQERGLLRIVESFIEDAPQLILQITIMEKNDPTTINFKNVMQYLKVNLALLSLGWCMTTYHRDVRLTQPEKTVITKLGLVHHLAWHALMTASRIISVSMVAARWEMSDACYYFLPCWFVIQSFVMTIWISAASKVPAEFARDGGRDPDIYPPTLSERIKSVMFASILGVVFFFAYVNIIDGPTIVNRTIYYAICFVGNALACYVSSYGPEDVIAKGFPYSMKILIYCIYPYGIGICSMLEYNRLIQKQKKQDLEISSNQLVAILTEHSART